MKLGKTKGFLCDLLKLRQMLLMSWHAQPYCFLGLLVIEVVQGAIPLLLAWNGKILFDSLVQGIQNGFSIWNRIIGLLLIQAGLQIFIRLIQPVSRILGYELSRHIMLSVQISILEKINSLAGLAPFDDPNTYDTIQMGVNGAQMGLGQISQIIISLINSLITLFSFIFSLLVFNPLLSLLVIITAFPQLFIQKKLGRQRFNLANKNTNKYRIAGYYNNLLTSAEFIKEIRLFNLGNYFLHKFIVQTEKINILQRKQQQSEFKWEASLGFFSNIVYNVAFAIVVLQAVLGKQTIGDISFFASAVGSVQSALGNIVSSLSQVTENIMYFSRYNDLMMLPQSIAIPSVSHPISDLKKGIELRNISFRYSDELPWVLHNVSLFIPAFKCTALVGLNGSGKTTIVKLLTRLYDPTEGTILWDGVDIREFDPIELRKKIGVIFQDFKHYDLSAMENIGLGDLSKIDCEDYIHDAARLAGIHETICKLPHGYKTILSRWLTEDQIGTDLSGGEWQKVALARTFMRHSDLLILDEPTSALDAQAEDEIIKKFLELTTKKTSLLVSHRFSAIQLADKIAVLENGKIIEYGSHATLLNENGIYARLYNIQAAHYS